MEHSNPILMGNRSPQKFITIGEVMLRLHDNGIGSEDPIGGFGLPGLQERVNLLRGRFNVQSSKGEGFTMEVGVPG